MTFYDALDKIDQENDAGKKAKEQGDKLIEVLDKKAGKKVVRFTFKVPLERICRWLKEKLRGQN